MILIDLKSLIVIDENGKSHTINANKFSDNPKLAFDNLSLFNAKKIISTFKNWFFLGFFQTQHNIINQLLPHIGKDKTIKLLNASLVEHNPIWGSFGEVNIKIAANIFSCSKTLRKILKTYNIKVKIDYSLLNTLKTLWSILFRSIVCVMLITFLLLRYTFKIKEQIPSNNNWFVSRGIIQSKEFKTIHSQANIAYLNSWFRPFQNSNFLKHEKNSFWLGNLINPLSIIKYYFKCLFKYGFFNSIRYGLVMPYIQLSLYGQSVSKLYNIQSPTSISTFEILYPFNDFLNFKKWNLYVTVSLPATKYFEYSPKHGETFFKYKSYWESQQKTGNLNKNISFKKIILNDLYSVTYSKKSKNCVFFTQPIEIENEIIIINQLINLCKNLNLNLYVQLHPRSNKSFYNKKINNKYIIGHYSKLKDLKYAFVRNSSLASELLSFGVPVFCCLWGKVKVFHEPSLNVSLIYDFTELINAIDD